MWSHGTFNELVEGKKDFVGMVAYTIYKKDKNQWIDTHKEKHGAYPTPEELDKYFYPSVSTKETIARYKKEAENLISDFLTVTLSEDIAEYQQQVRDDVIVKTIKKGFWRSVGESMTAALISSFIIAAFSTAYWLYAEVQNAKDAEKVKTIVEGMAIPEDAKEKILSSLKKN